MFIGSELPTQYYIARATIYQSEPTYTYLNEIAQIVHTKEEAQEVIDTWLKDHAVLHHEIERRAQLFTRAELDQKAARALARKLDRLRAENRKVELQLEEHIQTLLALPAPEED